MDIVLRLGERQRYSALRTKRRAIFHGKTISHSSHYAIIPRARLQFMTMAFGYAPQGSSGMSYCNQTPFPPREGWGLGTRLRSQAPRLSPRPDGRRKIKTEVATWRAWAGTDSHVISRHVDASRHSNNYKSRDALCSHVIGCSNSYDIYY